MGYQFRQIMFLQKLIVKIIRPIWIDQRVSIFRKENDMPRYIDADALIKKIFPYDVADRSRYTINAKAVYEAIQKAPTADVVPKSEVERLSVELEAMRCAANSYKMHYKEAEIAKVMLLDAIDTFRNLLCIESYLDYEDTRKHYVVSIDDVNRIHGELKKKYTEGQE